MSRVYGPPCPRNRVPALRAMGHSLHDAQQIWLRESLEYDISDIEDVGDVKRVLERIVARILPKTEENPNGW